MDWVDKWAHNSRASAANFRQNYIPPENKFELGYVLEAADLRIALHDTPLEKLSPYNSTNRRRRSITYSLAKVIEKDGPRIRLRHIGTDDRNDIWMMVDSDLIRPYPSGTELSVPFGFMNSHSVWSKIVAKVKNEEKIAPASWFPPHPQDPGKNKFKVGEKLEAVDRRNAQLICPATIGDVRDNYVRVCFDGWSGNFDYWTFYNSQDLFPVGWCTNANYRLQYPGPGYPLITNDNSITNKTNKRKSLPVQTNNSNNNILSPPPIKRKIKNEYKTPPINEPLKISVKFTKNPAYDRYSKSGISSPDSESTHLCVFDGDENSKKKIWKTKSNIKIKDNKDNDENNDKVKQAKKFISKHCFKKEVIKEEIVDNEDNNKNQDDNISNHSRSSSSCSLKKNDASLSFNCNFSSHSDKESDVIDNADTSSLINSPESVKPNNKLIPSPVSLFVSSDNNNNTIEQKSPEIHSPINNNTSQQHSKSSIATSSSSPDSIMNSSSQYTNLSDSLIQPQLSNDIKTNLFGSSNFFSDMPSNPSDWTVEDVGNYLTQKNPSLTCVLPDFRNHEIDGQALLLLNMNTLRQYMKIKLGPAIKIDNIIKNLLQGKL